MTDAPLLNEALPIELMNTIWADHDGAHDELDDSDTALSWLQAVSARLEPAPASVGAWLSQAHPSGLRDTARDLRRLRDAVRRLAAVVTNDPRQGAAASRIEDRDGALAVLNHACAHAPTWSELHWTTTGQPHRRALTTGSPGQVIVSMFAERAVELFTGDDHGRLRACLAPGCVLYFIAHHPRREWCSASCGNRARVARHYRRHRPASPDGV